MKHEIIYKPEETFKLPFSIERHMHTFIQYTEVVILPDGHVEYACPSHERKLIEIIRRDNPDMTMESFMKEAEEHGDVWDWSNYLMRRSKSICIYTHGYACPNDMEMTSDQQAMLHELVKHGLTTMKKLCM
jgi:hypothetical protein